MNLNEDYNGGKCEISATKDKNAMALCNMTFHGL